MYVSIVKGITFTIDTDINVKNLKTKVDTKVFIAGVGINFKTYSPSEGTN